MQNREIKEKYLELLKEKEKRYQYNKLNYLFPENDILDYPFNEQHTILSRNKYPKQIELFNASTDNQQLVFIGPNGSGKSLAGGYFDSVHLTGLYPEWWEGHKWSRGIKTWVAGINAKSVRDGIQVTLLGKESDIGSGLIPKHLILDYKTKAGVPGAIESVSVQHSSGNISELHFKSYIEEIAAYSGASDIDLIHLDEEPPLGIDTECTARIFRTNGRKILTFTPDKGLSETMLQIFPDGHLRVGNVGTGKYCVNLDMDDVPHYTEEQKRGFYNALPPYQREAKYYGRPSIGGGLIYPIFEGDIKFRMIQGVPDPKLPRAYGMDPGWQRTAVAWGAYDEHRDIWYVYDEYCRGQDNYKIHASAIKARGEWIYGVIDKAAKDQNGVLEKEKALDLYINEGLNLILSPAGKLVEAGIVEVWGRFSTGRLFIAEHCQNILKELRLYRRNEKGEIVTRRGVDGSGHDCLDAVRYLVCYGNSALRSSPEFTDDIPDNYGRQMQRNSITGY